MSHRCGKALRVYSVFAFAAVTGGSCHKQHQATDACWPASLNVRQKAANVRLAPTANSHQIAFAEN